MPTTTATITLSSGDMMDNNISLTNTSTLLAAGDTTGIPYTTGLARKKFASSSAADLVTIANEDATQDKSCKIYIKNTNARVASKYIIVLINGAEIGRLYGGDWMFMPLRAASGEDVEIDPSDATETIVEYMVFYE